MRLHAVRAPTRCAVCHDDLDGVGVACAGCNARAHLDCWADLGRCPSLGCAARAGGPPAAPRRRRGLLTGLLGLGAVAATPNEPPKGGAGPFPLLELLVGVSILGLIAAVLTANLLGRGHTSRVHPVAADMKAIGDALELFRVDCGYYPRTLDALWIRPANAKKWGPEPYLKEYPPKDPWGNEYQYQYGRSVDGWRFEIVSFGADGVPGGTEEGTDLSSRAINNEERFP